MSTPNSSLQSPASFSLESPRSSFHESPSPCLSFNFDRRSPPTTEELSEFLQVKYFTAEIFFFIIDNKNNLNNSFLYFCVKLFFWNILIWKIYLQASAKCEKDLSNLTLSDKEQRELYQAAQIIQKAYRSYKGRKKIPTRTRVCPSHVSRASSLGPCPDVDSDQNKEAKAAVVIQNYYRRYKQVLYKYFGIKNYLPIGLIWCRLHHVKRYRLISVSLLAFLNYFPVSLFVFFLS